MNLFRRRQDLIGPLLLLLNAGLVLVLLWELRASPPDVPVPAGSPSPPREDPPPPSLTCRRWRPMPRPSNAPCST